MDGPLATVVIVLSLLLAAWSVVLLLIDRPGGGPLYVGMAVLELAAVAYAVVGVAQLFSDRTFDKATFVGYLVALVAIPPGAAWWSWGERSRAATGVLLVMFLVVPFLVLRLQQIWSGSVA